MAGNDWGRMRARGVVAMAIAASMTGPAAAAAQSVTGQARAVHVSALVPTVLADTGTLSGANDLRDAAVGMAVIPALLNGEGLHAVTLGWPDQVVSEASIGNLRLTLGLTVISADFVGASAVADAGSSPSASTTVESLFVNGVAVAVTGAPNQRVTFPGGQLLINQQLSSPTGITVNALRATVLGAVDVVVASATAGIQ